MNTNLNPARYHRRKQRLNGSRNRSLSAEKSRTKRLVMGEVRILKRGEDLDVVKKKRKKKNEDTFVSEKAGDMTDENLSSAYRLVLNPEKIATLNRARVKVSDLYAGAACYPSPPPSSLPFPIGLIKGGTNGLTVIRKLC